MDLNKMQQLVLGVIRKTPGSENDDAALIAAVWRQKGWDDKRTLEENIRRMPRPESITRRRRELHEKGLIHYSKDAMEMREEAFRNERELHGALPWLYDEKDV